jgi:predicted transcriptional regulator
VIKFYHIDTALAKQLRLSGAEKDVYFALRGFRGGVSASQSILADDLCMMRKTFNNAISCLIKKGLVTATRNGKIYTYNVYPKGTDTCTEKVQVLYPKGTDTCTEKVQDTLNTINNNISEENTHAHTHTRTYEEDRLIEMQNLGKTYPTSQLAEELKAELTQQPTTAISAQQMFGRPANQLVETVDLFVAKLNLDGETLKNRGDFRRHWQSWLKANIKTIFSNNNNGNTNDNLARNDAAYLASILADLQPCANK